MLEKISSHTKKEGYLFLEVPNLCNIEDSNIVEEFFSISIHFILIGQTLKI